MPSMKCTHSCVLHSLVITGGGSSPLPSHASRAESTTPNLRASTFGALAGMPVPYTHSSSSASLTRSDEHTSELQSLMRISYAVFCLKKQKQRSHKNKTATPT